MYARTILAAILALAGCSGTIDGGGQKPGGGGPTPPNGPGMSGAGSGSGNGSGSPSGPGSGSTTNNPGAALPPVGADPLEPDRSSPVCKDITPGPAPHPPAHPHRIRQHRPRPAGRGSGARPRPSRPRSCSTASTTAPSCGRSRTFWPRTTTTPPRRLASAWWPSCGTFLPCDPAKDGGSRPAWTVSWMASPGGSGGGRWTRSEKADLKQVFTAGRPPPLPRGSTRWCG